MSRSRGQASVELVVASSLLMIAILAGLGAIRAGAEQSAADAAAHAGALALAAGEPPRPAARRALPGWARSGARVRVGGGGVLVEIEGAGLGQGPARSRAFARPPRR